MNLFNIIFIFNAHNINSFLFQKKIKLFSGIIKNRNNHFIKIHHLLYLLYQYDHRLWDQNFQDIMLFFHRLFFNNLINVFPKFFSLNKLKFMVSNWQFFLVLKQ